MNPLSRPLVAAAFSMLMVLTAWPAAGQKFLPAEIVEAESINEEMRERIMMAVEPVMFDLTEQKAKPKDITDARQQLLQLFRTGQPSAAYLEALSAAITTSRMEDAVAHESTLVRINAMIILSSMVDDGSKRFIDAGLSDKNPAVQRWAMEALGKRMIWWKIRAASGTRGAQTKIDDAIKQIANRVDQAAAPHPVVVDSAFDALLKVDTPASREVLVDLLNKRVALHAEDPDLSYSAERAVIESFSNALTIQVPPDFNAIKGLNRAMARYAALIVEQMQANRIAQENQDAANSMLFQCLQGMASVSVAAKAPKAPPAGHNEARGWIANGRWEELKNLIQKDWAPILTADPFNLKPGELAVKP